MKGSKMLSIEGPQKTIKKAKRKYKDKLQSAQKSFEDQIKNKSNKYRRKNRKLNSQIDDNKESIEQLKREISELIEV
jgi:predicted RNase H-like nuclease (RuvC/YqgF family)